MNLSIEDQLKKINSIMKEKKLPDFTLTWGKYTGNTLADIEQIDPGYIEWLRSIEIKDPRLKEILAQT